MPGNEQIPLRLSEWLETPRFSYMLYWLYPEPLIPDKAEVDVRVQPYDLKYNKKTFIGTFITPKELPTAIEDLFEELKFSRECADGTYVPLKHLSDRLLVREISGPVIVKTIDDLLANNSFTEHFEEESPEE